MFTPDDERRVLDSVPQQLLIGGQWRGASSGKEFAVTDPATEQVLCTVADAAVEDGAAALAAAEAAQRAWSVCPPRERGEILRRAYELLMQRQDELALLMTLEMGKPLAESRGEIAYSAEFFRWFSEEAVRIHGDYAVAPDGKSRFLLLRQPIGVCLFVTPWNFPMAMGARKLAPAIAAGCTMVIKPASQTPLSMLALASILGEAGLPDGVLNVITTTASGEVMEPLIRSGVARKLSFTGSTAVGRALLAQSSEHIVRTSLELGGNAPFLVFADADLGAALDAAMIAKMRNIGEACTAANRFYVHAEIADAFADGLVERMAALTMGRGVDESVQVGPLIDAAAQAKVAELVHDARQQGARALLGGRLPAGSGHFYPPTVLSEVTSSARVVREEIFGPVAPISTFTDEDEAIFAANDTEFGLVSYVYTADLERALRVCERLETGMVGLNQGLVSNPAAPFGGVKESGIGREGGVVGIGEYLELKYVSLPSPTS